MSNGGTSKESIKQVENWTVLSYSVVKLPLPPFKKSYLLVVIEDEVGTRRIAQAEIEFEPLIKIGTNGTIATVSLAQGEITRFTPLNVDSAEPVQKVALVTGAGRGIGRAIALELAQLGYAVIVNNSSNTEEGWKTLGEIKKAGGKGTYIQASVANPTQVESLFQRITQEFDRLDVLVNNAGMAIDKKAENLTLEQWNAVINVNLTGTFLCSQAALKLMQNQGGGKIVNISSIVGQMGNFGQSSYSASKAGMIALTKTLAKEYAGDGITVNAIAPGFIDTDMLHSIPPGVLRSVVAQIPVGRLGRAGEIAKAVVFLVSDGGNYITGQVLNVNGGLLMS